MIKNRIIEKIKSSPLLYRLAKGAFWSLLGTVATRVFSMITTIFIARILGKENYGAYGMVQSTLGMFGLFAGFAMGSTMTKYLAEFRSDNPERAGSILSLSMTISILCSAFVSLVIIASSPWLASTTLKRPDLAPILITGSVLLFVSTLNNVQVGALAGFEAFKATARINLIQAISTPIVSIPLVYLYGIQGAIVSLIIISALGYVLCHIALKGESRSYDISYRHFDISAFKEWHVILKFSLPAMLSGMLVIPVTWITNMILVNQQSGYAELGLFNAANQWRQFIIFVPQILASVMLPIFSEAHGKNDKQNFVNAFRMNLHLTWVIALPITILLITLRNPLSQCFGSQYSGIAPVIALLMIASFLNIVNNVVGTALVGAGRMWIGTAFNLGWAVVLLVSAKLLTSTFGAFGLALAYLIAYFSHTVWQMIYAEAKLVQSSILSKFGLVSITIVTLICAYFMDYFGPNSSLFGLTVVIIATLPLFKLISKIKRTNLVE